MSERIFSELSGILNEKRALSSAVQIWRMAFKTPGVAAMPPPGEHF